MFNTNVTNYVNTCGCCTMDSSPWYNESISVPTYNFIMDITAPSNSREQRNKAEKMRRDKLNSYISELACLVPLISKSPKRMDKTSILRLTATHLRIYQTLLNGNTERMNIPRNVDQIVLDTLVYEQLGGFLMILTITGKVVFVSQTIENILGHLQTDLMGQSILNIVAHEEHEKLRQYLASETLLSRDWRKYFNIKLRRAGPRSETPVYETVNMMGMQMITPSNGTDSQMGESSSTVGSNSNHMWVFFVRIHRPEPIREQLMEASRDEYVTRHLVDGRIINCDQRISIIAGYMTEEISGLSAFKFMHREDVRWVMIALRQMYDKGESRGTSCYRLLSRTGQFIYLKTFGFLEIDSTGTVESFICINSLVAEKEGLKMIQEMKHKYSALIRSASPKLKLSIDDTNPSNGSVEDPSKLEQAIAHLITDLPSPESESSESPSCHENQDCPLTPSTDYSSSSPRPSKNIYIKVKTATKRPPNRDVPSSSNKRHKHNLPETPPYHHRPSLNEISVTSDHR